MSSYATYIFLPSHYADIQIGDEDPCVLPKDSGMGHAYFPSYYYDALQHACLPFVYRGVKGNANRFRTIYECEAVCMMNIN
ncbi:unnamed protein product [Hymenolepis diminuta]|nr:unnamed protein product [Hymenolepis diminuta]